MSDLTKSSMSTLRFCAPVVLLAALFHSTTAQAQAYLVAEDEAVYEPIGEGEGQTLTRSGDAQLYEVAIPFDFRFFSRGYEKVWVSVNGGVTFLGVDPFSGQLNALPDQNVSLPSASSPQATLAAVWDDWTARPDARGGGSRIATAIRTVEKDGETHQVLVIDWQRVQRYGNEGPNAPSYSFQLLLHEGSHQYELRFGPVVAPAAGVTAAPIDATSGSENHLGTVGVAHNPCQPTCGAATFFPSPTLLVSPNLDAELVLTLSKVGVENGGPIIDVFAQNLGLSAAEELTFDLYLSTDPVLDAGDTLVYSAPATFDLGARPAEARFRVPITVPVDAKGARYIVGRLEGVEPISELNKANNIAAIAQPFIAGVDLSVETFGQTAADAGGRSSYNVRVRNAGVRAAANVKFEMRLAGGTLVTPVKLYESVSLEVGAEASALVNLSVTMPANLPPGAYYIETFVDPANEIDEADETNNRSERLNIELRGADVAVSNVSTGVSTGHLGQTVPVQFTLSNLGTAHATDFLYAVYLSKDNDVITRQDTRVLLSEPVSLAPRESRVITRFVMIPESLETGLYFAGIIADAAGVVRELDLSNNVAPASDPIIVAPRAADLVAAAISTQPRAAAGAAVRVTAVLGNIGNEAATFAYSVHLSDNELVSASDARIAAGSMTLQPSQQRTVSFDARLPATLRAGHYRVALLADPEGAVVDVNRANNAVVSSTLLEVGEPALHILNESLPDALVDTHYEVLLGAAGGAASPRWSLAGGALPQGLTLDETGRLSGVPTADGVFAIVVEATSAELRALSSFTLAVREYAASLGVLDTHLPSARRGVPYSQQLGVTGGTGTPAFALESGTLPPGLALDEDGTVSGYPTSAGEFTFTVEVQDEAGQRVTAKVSLAVHAEGALTLLATRLREAEVARAYSAVLPIEGGKAPYTVSVAEGRLPEGLSFGLEASGVAALLTGTPLETGVHAFTVVVADSRGERTLEHLVLEVSARRLSFITTELPVAGRGTPYRAVIEANAKAPFIFSIAGGALPEGLTLDESGLITGAVASDAAGRLHAFAVRVTDVQGGEALAAFSIEVPAPPKPVEESGCANGGSTMAFFGLLPLFFVLRRRRTAAATLSAALVVCAALPANAYYLLETHQETYEPLPDEGTTTLYDAMETGFDQSSTSTRGKALPIPFGFKFYGVDQTIAGVTTKGLVTFGSVSLSWSRDDVRGLPAAGGPSQLIAPMWGYVQMSKFTPTTPSTIRWRLEGEAPRRVLAIEWHNLQHAGWTPPYKGEEWAAYSFQVRLHEGTNEISMHYGGDAVLLGRTPPLAFSMGVEGLDGVEGMDVSDTRCSPSCSAANFPLDTVVRLQVVPDLSIELVESPESLFEGVETRVRAVVKNSGDNDASRMKIRYFISKDQFIDDGDVVLADSPALTIVAASSATVNTKVTVPEGTEPGLYFLLARVDPDDEIVELDETNNDYQPVPVVVLGRAPDFVPVRLLGPNAVDVGVPFAITRTIRNDGSAVGSGHYRVVLSDNPLASMADLVLDEGSFSLATGEVLDASPEITIPSTVTPGTYYLALLVRPADGQAEIDSLDNDRLFGPVIVRGGGLAITREALPDVAAGVEFSLQFTAAGGAGHYRWSIGQPEAPSGVTLSESGVLSGRVETTGEWSVQVRVESQGATVSRTYRLRATGVVSPLRVVTTRTGIAQLAAPHVSHLLAQGGAPPYSWSLVGSSALPAGLRLSADGTLEGVPLVDGEAHVSVRVKDAEGASADGTFVVPIAGPTRPLFASIDLAPARIGTAYEATVRAAGGEAPYRYSVVDTRRVPGSDLEQGRYFVGELPPGLALSSEGAITGTPTLVGTYVVTMRLVDARSSDATSQFAFVVQSDGTLSVRTTALPDATIGVPFDAQLSSTGAIGSAGWEAVFSESGAAMPAGLVLLPEGRIVGTPLATGQTSFLAIVRDGAGQVAMQPLSLRVVQAPVVTEEGCAQAGGSSVFALLVVLALFVRRSAMGGVVAAVALALAGCSDTKSSVCADTCSAPFACDENDGLCKCGGEGGAVCTAGESCEPESRTCLAPSCDTGCPSPLVCGEGGECRCGSTAGPVCDAGESCSAFGRCEPVSRCDGVVCAAGMSCNEATGACGCGNEGVLCADNERCLEASCVADRCLGVACSGGNACDPNDGLCKCGGEGGAVCTGGEACNPVAAECVRSSRCEGVSCGLGSSCDPSDGLCKCGGSGGPVCGFEQSCDPVERRCLGGDQCQGVTCSGGTSCDPEDGLCKCGGYGGAVCGDASVCVVQGAQARCETSCDLLSSSCDGGLGCVWNPSVSMSYCATVGRVLEGQTCGGTAGTCSAGLHCAPTGSVCRAYCLVSQGCGDNAVCFPFQPGDETGACVPFTAP